MYLKNKKEIDKFVNTTNEGTQNNPKIVELPWNYKVPLYLGYKIKWDYDFDVKEEYNPFKRTYFYTITAKFKKGHDSFNCFWDYSNWDFLMEVLLPKMQADNLITAEICSSILKYDRESVTLKCFDIIKKQVKDAEFPFVNVVERVEKFNKHKIR